MRLQRMLLIVGCMAAASLTGCATTATGSRGGGATSTPALTVPATPNAVTTSPPAVVVPSSPPPAVVHTTAPPVVHTTAPALVVPTTAAPAPVGCMPLTNSGGCYKPGEFCRTSDHGAQGVAGDGKTIVCEDNGGWRWEPVP